MDNKNFVANEEATFVVNQEQSGSGGAEGGIAQAAHPGPPPDYFTDDLPPAYQVASALPTYEEAELTKGKLELVKLGSIQHYHFSPSFQKASLILT